MSIPIVQPPRRPVEIGASIPVAAEPSGRSGRDFATEHLSPADDFCHGPPGG